MSRTLWAWIRLLGGAAILGVLVWRVGSGPFLDGLRRLNVWSLAAAAGIAVITTVCAAWRWSVVARGLGVSVPLGRAVAFYYRSQFLNTVLPGGVLGDVHRAIDHGRAVGDVGHSARAVAWERTAGQAVQFALALVVLLVLPSPVRSWVPVALGAVVVAALLAVLVWRFVPRDGPSRWSRTLRGAASDLRGGLLAPVAWPRIVTASLIVVAGHAATFVIAARTAGVHASLGTMLPLAMLVLLAMSLPINIGGWGPREGVAAWAFGLAGLSAAAGVTTAVVYGVMVLVATLPGAFVLVIAGRRRRTPEPVPARPVRATGVVVGSGRG
ncbi:MAG TPA: lysylphosphatidylglycerol synthase transmembrane domain-containing protein [Micromonosporaceae bacterium]|jgi:uncharacterized membrane protein YbhN (UPF0104 family)